MDIYVYIVLGVLIGFALVAIGLGLMDLFAEKDLDELEWFPLDEDGRA